MLQKKTMKKIPSNQIINKMLPKTNKIATSRMVIMETKILKRTLTTIHLS